MERGNRVIQQRISALKDTVAGAWSRLLPRIMYHLNVQSSKTTGKLPYELVFGQLPRTTLFPDCNVNVIDEEKLDNGERESNLDDPACTDDIVHEVSDTEEDQVPATELIDSDTDSKSSSIIIQDNDDDPISTY